MTSSREEMKRMLENVQKVIRARTVNTSAGSSNNCLSSDDNIRSHNNYGDTEMIDARNTSDDNYTLPLRATAERKRSTFNTLNARDNEREFVEHYYRTLCSFVQDKSRYEMELPNLSAFDRLVVHALAEKCNLSHLSSGTGEERTLHVKKDTLFFQHPNAAREVDIDDILRKVKSKESKFHLKRTRAVDPAELESGEIGSYADDDALRKIERFKRATDEYRHATQIGMTQEEMENVERQANNNNSNINDMKGGGNKYAQQENSHDVNRLPSASPETKTSSISARIEDILRQPVNTIASTAQVKKETIIEKSNVNQPHSISTPKLFDEVCNGCHVHVRVNYDVSGWKCSKYCAHCARQTIWKLEEVAGSNNTNTSWNAKNASESLITQDASNTTKAAAAAVNVTNMHVGINDENDKDNDEPITVEDVMEMAAMNDYSVDDMNWIRRFASLHARHLNENIVFCIEFTDLLDLHIFSDYDKSCNHNININNNNKEEEESSELTAEQESEEVVKQALCENRSTLPSSTSSLYVVVREVKELDLRVTSLAEIVTTELLQLPCSTSGQNVKETIIANNDNGSRTDQSALPNSSSLSHPSLLAAAVQKTSENEEMTTKSEPTVANASKDRKADVGHSNDVELRTKMEHLALAFCNVSVYGVEAIALCQLRPYVLHAIEPLLTLDMSKCLTLSQKYGSSHFYYTTSLREAVQYASHLN